MKLFYYLLFFVFPCKCLSQTYSATYYCIVNNKELIAKSNGIDSFKKEILNFILPDKMKIIYEVISDSNYIDVHGYVDSNNTNLKSQVNSSHMIIDLKKRLTIDIDENKYYEIKTNTIKNTLAISSGIENYDSAYSVSFSKTLPSFVTPFLIFSNAGFGLASLITPKMSFNLIKANEINKKLDYKALFENIKITKELKSINFLN